MNDTQPERFERFVTAARRFARAAGRKSSKRAAVRAALRRFDAGEIDRAALRSQLVSTQPWQSHGPLH